MSKPTTKEDQQPKKQAEKPVIATTEVKKQNTEVKTGTITHKGFPEDAIAQKIIRYAYDKYGDMEFIKMMECENGSYNIASYGDSGHARGMCQLNDNWHKADIYNTAYLTDYKVAVDICYEHRQQHTKFYGYITRKINGVACPKAVENRFYFK